MPCNVGMGMMGLDISFDGYTLMAGFVFGVIGMWMFREGRRKENMNATVIGVLLMVYPYFVESRKATFGVGLGLCGLAYLIWDR